MKRKKLALSLRGGGSRVAGYLGVIKAFQEKGIEPDLYITSSAGSLVGGGVAAGVDMEKIVSHMENFTPREFVGIDSLHDMTIASDDMSIEYAKRLVGDIRLEDMKIPLHIRVTNLSLGRLEYISTGPAAETVVTSALLPFVYRPRQLGEHMYSDGDILSGYGVDFARKKGVDIVIGIEPESADKYVYRDKRPGSYLSMIELLRLDHLALEKKLHPPNIIIQTPDFGVNMMDFSKSRQLAQEGYEIGKKEADTILELLA